MRTHNRNTKVMVAIASFALLAAACGSDTNDASTATAAVPAATDAPMTTDGMADGPFGPACSAVPADGAGSFAGMADDTAATAASNNPLLSTLVAAVTEAGLVDTLNSDGPFTIFAPTNDAFGQIPADDLDAVLADKELLTSILTYHVIGGENLDATALGAAGSATTVNGAELEFGSDGTTVNGVDVLCSDVVTANATVHIIGEVLMPPTDDMESGGMDDNMDDDMDDDMEGAVMPAGPLCSAVPADGEGSFAGMTDDTAATAASNNPVLSTLVTAVTEAGLVDTLNSDGPFTIFAPTNPAFDALPAGTLDAVLADTDLLTSILTLHVVAGERLSSDDLAQLDSVTTVNGADISLEVAADGSLMVNGQATVGCADIQTANATVHVIDAVLMP
jgi:transforming growth factor-beta-induced protein